jgi:hypothetical protein
MGNRVDRAKETDFCVPVGALSQANSVSIASSTNPNVSSTGGHRRPQQRRERHPDGNQVEPVPPRADSDEGVDEHPGEDAHRVARALDGFRLPRASRDIGPASPIARSNAGGSSRPCRVLRAPIFSLEHASDRLVEGNCATSRVFGSPRDGLRGSFTRTATGLTPAGTQRHGRRPRGRNLGLGKTLTDTARYGAGRALANS